MKTRNPSLPYARCSFTIPSLTKSIILTGSVVSLICTAPKVMADATWTNADGNQNWNDVNNWSTNPSGQNVYIGAVANSSGSAYPILSANSTFTPNDIYVGQGTGSIQARLDQTAGSLSTGNGNWMQVGMDGGGDGGNGVFNLANTGASGGTLTGYGQGSGTFTSNNSDFEVGRGGGSVGLVNIDTSGSLNVGGTFSIGNYGGNGTVKMDGGTINASNSMLLGQNGGTGTFSMSGGTVNVSGQTLLGVSGGGTGTISISGGTFNAGTANSSSDVFDIGGNSNSGSTGTVTITGGTLVVTASAQLIVGDTGNTGTLNINGGTVTTPSLTRYGTGTVNFNGGTLQASAGNANFIDSGLVVNVNAAGGTIDSQANTIGTSASIVTSSGGVLTKVGSGTFTLGGSGDNVSLGATVAGGTLVLGKTSGGGVHALGGDLTINGGATAQLGGSGGDQIYLAAGVIDNGTFDTAGQSEGFNNLTGGGTVLNSSGTASALTVGQNNGSGTYTGTVSNANGGVTITKTGSGTLTVNSSTTNGFAPGQLTVGAGTVLLGGSDKIGNGTAIVLSGGTFATGGFSEGARATGGNGLGALTLSSTSTLDFGPGSSSILHFSGLGTHTTGADLTIVNWDGVPTTGGGTEALLFDGSTSDFTSTYSQGEVSFDGVNGYAAVQFSGFYEITAVPEPATFLGGAALAALLAYRERRRWLGSVRVMSKC